MAEQFLTTRQAAAKWDVPLTTVQWWARSEFIPGAFKIGNTWLIPADVTPDDIKRRPPGRPPKEASDE